MKNFSAFLLFLFVSYFFMLIANAQFPVGSVSVTPSVLTTNLQVPWELVWGADNFIWMTERYGRISRVNPANGQVTPLITIPDVHQTGESGLLGLALHPNFTQTPHVFVVYTYLKNNVNTEKIVRYTYNGTILNAPLVLLDNIPAASTHDGSRLLILPDQTMLITTGDAANTSLSQNMSSLSGKVLRMNLDGSIPASNPFPGSYVYSFGHRNAQGLTIGPNGRWFSSEHGASSDDEFNEIVPGRNYGWPTVQGLCNTTAEQTFCSANNVKEPLATWSPTIAVAGIAYYNHAAIPGWQNSILMTTLKGARLVQLALNPAGNAVTSQTVFLNGTYGRLRSICVSPAGKVYIGTSNRDGRGAPAATDDRIIVLENLTVNPTGIYAEAASKPDIKVNVIPGESKIQLIFSQGLKGEKIFLYALNGKCLIEKQIPGDLKLEINTYSLPKGLHLIRASNTFRKIIIP